MKLKKVLKFIAYTTAFTAIYNKAVAVLATGFNLLKTSDGQYFQWDYGKIFYTKKGEGSPILLLHDLTSASGGHEWSKIEDELAKNHTVYTPDLLGCGRSDKPGISYSNFLYVKFLTCFLTEVIAEPCTVVATGNSSSFTILGSTFSSSLIKKVICINPVNPNGLDQSKNFGERVVNTVLSVPIYGTTLYNHYLSQDKIKKQFINQYFYKETDDIKSLISVYHESAHRKLRFARNFYAAERLNYCVLPVKHMVPNIKFPMDIIVGEYEKGADEICEMYKSLNENITVKKVEDTKHLPQLESPDKLMDVLF